MNPCIVLPTYNEREYLPTLVQLIRLDDRHFHLIIVDDNSPDGTGEIADALAKRFDGITVVHRESKEGVGSAIAAGLKIAVEMKFDVVVTMDADLSHSPHYLKKFMFFANDYDLLIGSRYLRGVRVEGWRFRKLLLSKLANMYVAYLMVKPIWDFTSGYRVYSRDFLRRIDLNSLPADGYMFQIHMIYLAYALKLRVKEISFVFKDAEGSVSKMSWQARWFTVFRAMRYRAPILEILRHLTFLRKDYTRFVHEYEELLCPPKLKNGGHFEIPEKLDVSVGVMAYNEEANIANCLKALQSQEMKSGKISQIVVVSSGSTDRTDEIVREMAEQDSRIQLIVEKERRGKASAINEYLLVAEGDVVILESADTITYPETIEHLVKPFFDPKVGTNGAHPIPVNSENNFIGFCVNKLWALHHHIALHHPKCGELIAFRNIIPKIPFYTAVDEAIVEAIFRAEGYEIHYAPDALVRNKGPENLNDFVKQRKRIAVGHKHLLATTGYQVATFRSSMIFKYILKEMRWTPRGIVYMAGLIMVEGYCRVAATMNFHLFDKNPFVWSISKTTKKFDAAATQQDATDPDQNRETAQGEKLSPVSSSH